MRLKSWFIVLSGMAVVSLFALLAGCGGASLDYGQVRNLQSVKPDFVNPPWYEDYTGDPAAAATKYKKKVLQLDVRLEGFEELAGGIEIKGYTGESDGYRVACLFPAAEGTKLQSLTSDDRIVVKGQFNRIEDMSNTYRIYLTGCVLIRE